VIGKIIRAADITKDDLVIEIGPGIGSLTQFLAESAAKVIAVEIDKSLIPVLDDTLGGYDNIEIINEDILKVDLDKLLDTNYKNIKVVANLPYYITTPIIMNFLTARKKVNSMTVMMQKEVANRIKASPKTKAYGSLTITVSYYAKVSLAANVPQNCFIPRPNVDSAVLHLELTENKDVKPKDEELMFAIIRDAFAQRRKTLVNSVSNVNKSDISKEQLIEILKSVGISEKARAEELDLRQYALLSDKIGGK